MGYEDYLKRQFDKLGQVLGKLLADLIGLKGQGQIDEGIALTNQTLKAQLDLDIDDIIAIPDEELLNRLSAKSLSDDRRLELIADILYEISEGEYQYLAATKRKSLLKKVLSIYEFIEKRNIVFSLDNHNKIDRITRLLVLD